MSKDLGGASSGAHKNFANKGTTKASAMCCRIGCVIHPCSDEHGTVLFHDSRLYVTMPTDSDCHLIPSMLYCSDFWN